MYYRTWFLDELGEVNRRVIEGLRQPLEDKCIQKNQGDMIESDFILIGCMNPCDCGFLNSKSRRCVCARAQIEKSSRKMMSPLFQRFDICVRAYSESESASLPAGESAPAETDPGSSELSGESIYQNILRVRKIQGERRDAAQGKARSAETRAIDLEIDRQNEIGLCAEEKELLADILKRFYLSKREISSLLRVARTIADIGGSSRILNKHILEAVSFKNKSG